MKKQLLFLSLALLLAGGGFFTAQAISSNKLPDLTLANIEAFSAGIETNRLDKACVYEVSGRVGGRVEFIGIGIFTVGVNGYATYINHSGKTICSGLGDTDCTSHYCMEILSRTID